MAQLVLALGTSHSPLLALRAPEWEARSRNDRTNKRLVYTDGSVLTYDELAERVSNGYAEHAVPERWVEQKALIERSLDRLAEDVEAAAPDAVIVIGDDEHELFSSANMPALSVYCGDGATTRKFARDDDPLTRDPDYAWMKTVAEMYGMESNIRIPTRPDIALDLVDHLIDARFDVGFADRVVEPERLGFGHAFGFVYTRLMRRRNVPIVPVVINTYFPPNQPTPQRCYQFGAAIRDAIDRLPSNLRVAVIASGGLSHFVTNEPLDRAVIAALREDDSATLCSLPRSVLNDGSSEIRCWIALGGVLRGMRSVWCEYVPVYRTPAGTGIGLAFGAWETSQ